MRLSIWCFNPAIKCLGANQLGNGCWRVFTDRFMGHNKGKDNVKKRAVRRKKNDRLQAAKDAAKASAS